MTTTIASDTVDISEIISSIPKDPAQSAQSAGLLYISDDCPGISRKRVGRGFSYFKSNGDRITDPTELERLKALPIPPSWNDVWICPNPEGHLLATGRDAKGRKQYRYHTKWQTIRSQTKFDRIVAFGYARPLIRQVTDQHLRLRKLSREKLLAVIVRLLEETLIRVGNDEYAQRNKSFGLTTLRNRHVELSTTKVWFRFRGKSGVEHEVELSDRRLARAIKQCQEIAGYELFQYLDEDGKRQSLGSSDVNDYLREITQEEFTSKDFRTWGGTAEMAIVLEEMGQPASDKDAQKNIREAVKRVAQQLGNRVATCRNYYIHPTVIKAYEEGWLLPTMQTERERFKKTIEATPGDPGLLPDEYALLAVLQRD